MESRQHTDVEDPVVEATLQSQSDSSFKSNNAAEGPSPNGDCDIDEAFAMSPLTLADDDCDLLLVDLPEVALVKVMEYLNLKERYYLSMMCTLFYNLFTHPHLWQIAHIDLMCLGASNTKSQSRWKFNSVMNSTMMQIVKRFSHVFQHLSLNLDFDIQSFDDVSAKLLHELRNNCLLESLSLKLGPLTSDDQHVRRVRAFRSNPKDVPIVVGLIHSAVRLKRLRIVSWPLFEKMEDLDILLAIQSNEKLKSLESLSLFFVDVKKQNWTERIPKLPSISQTLNVISFLPNLTHVALRSPMINDDIILLLASQKRKRLELLQILVTFAYSTPYHEGFKTPEIASSSWLALTSISPSLRVEYVVMTRIPWEQLANLLKPEVPLSSLSLLNYSQCDGNLIDCIANHYGSTLRTFKSLCDSADCDNALIRLVTECQGLESLAFHGTINYKTVMALADLTKDEQEKWDLFQFKEQNVKTNPMQDDDQDTVIKYDAVNQRYYLGAVSDWHVDEDMHQSKIDEMVDYVRRLFGAAFNLC